MEIYADNWRVILDIAVCSAPYSKDMTDCLVILQLGHERTINAHGGNCQHTTDSVLNSFTFYVFGKALTRPQ
jgi:hypothetical protein